MTRPPFGRSNRRSALRTEHSERELVRGPNAARDIVDLWEQHLGAC